MSEENQPDEKKHFDMQRIYLKDVSFETPNSPAIFLEEWKPNIDVQVGTETNTLDDGVFEVVLKVTVTNTIGEKTAFLAEVHQAGIFSVSGFSDQEMTHMVGSYCPNMLFPYAREAVTNLVTKGSFPQFVLAPVNFDALLAQHLANQANQNEQLQ
jgi:preprotein translocase subunit SecB